MYGDVMPLFPRSFLCFRLFGFHGSLLVAPGNKLSCYRTTGHCYVINTNEKHEFTVGTLYL